MLLTKESIYATLPDCYFQTPSYSQRGKSLWLKIVLFTSDISQHCWLFSRFPFLFPFYILLSTWWYNNSFLLWNCYEISNVDHGHKPDAIIVVEHRFTHCLCNKYFCPLHRSSVIIRHQQPAHHISLGNQCSHQDQNQLCNLCQCQRSRKGRNCNRQIYHYRYMYKCVFVLV